MSDKREPIVKDRTGDLMGLLAVTPIMAGLPAALIYRYAGGALLAIIVYVILHGLILYWSLTRG